MEATKMAPEITPPQPETWARIQFGFLTRLFGYGGIASLVLGVFVIGLALVSAKDTATGVTRALIVIGIVLCFASMPRLGVLAPPILLLVGIIDAVLALFLRLVSIPLVFFSGLGLVTNMVGTQLGNAGHWIRAHGAVFGRLKGNLAASGSGVEFSRVADGRLPGDEDGFWGSEGDNGPFWILRRHGENMALVCSASGDSVHSLTREQVSEVQIIERRRFGSPEAGKILLVFPQEHALVFPFQLKPEGDPGLTLLIGHEASAAFARLFYSDNLGIRKLAARTSKIAVASVWLSLLGPIGLITGIYSLIQIRKSDSWLKGQSWSWFGITMGALLTGVIIFALSISKGVR